MIMEKTLTVTVTEGRNPPRSRPCGLVGKVQVQVRHGIGPLLASGVDDDDGRCNQKSSQDPRLDLLAVQHLLSS